MAHEVIHPGEIVLDIGANTGAFALQAYAAKAARVYSIEADTARFEAHRRNVQQPQHLAINAYISWSDQPTWEGTLNGAPYKGPAIGYGRIMRMVSPAVIRLNIDTSAWHFNFPYYVRAVQITFKHEPSTALRELYEAGYSCKDIQDLTWLCER